MKIIELLSIEEFQRLQAEADYLAEVRSRTNGPICEEDFLRLLGLAERLQQMNQ